jgi:copper chaperone CopZ
METQAHTTLTISGKQCQHCAQTVTSTLNKPLGSADAKAPFILSDGKCPTK